MKFREYREFAEAISEVLQNLKDDEWDSGRLKKKANKPLIYPWKMESRKSWKKCMYQSDQYSFLEKTLEHMSNQKTASVSRRDDE